MGIANQIRGIAHEYGVCFPLGIRGLCREVPDALEDADNELTTVARDLIARRFRNLLAIRDEIKRTSEQIIRLGEALPPWPRLMELPGFGVMVTSSYLASIGDDRQFKCGRQVSAWLELVPRQYGTGGKVHLRGMTKSGDHYLRTMMLHGARAAIRWSRGKDTLLAHWIGPMIERRGFNKAVVALANNNARIAWNIVANDARYDPGTAFGSA